jgi:Mn2+/Fe2+ NRAMP family transporter
MSPKKMQFKDLRRLTLTTMICTVMFAVTLAYAGLTDEALSASQQVEKMSIVGVLAFGLMASMGLNIYLVKVRDGKFTTLVETAVLAMQTCHESRERWEREKEKERLWERERELDNRHHVEVSK